MRRFLCFTAWVALATAGCTVASLDKQTLDLAGTVEQYRIDATLDCLATVAAHPDALPSFSLLANGTVHIQDTGSMTSITSWTRAARGFATESFGMSYNHSPQGQWTVDPVGSFSQLDALRAACRWALLGPQAAWDESPGILLDAATDYSPQHPHFGVADRLSRLPPNWVHIGRKKDVPKCAAYSDCCCDTYIWIMPPEKWCFTEFMLVLHDIATRDPDSGAYSPPLLVTITRTFTPEICQKPGLTVSGGQANIQFVEYRVVRPEWRQWIEFQLAQAYNSDGCVGITEQQWLAATYAYNGTRSSSRASAGGAPQTPKQQSDFAPASRPPFVVNQFGVVHGPTAGGFSPGQNPTNILPDGAK